MAKKKKTIETQEITNEDVMPGMLIKLSERIKDVNAQGKEKERVQFFEGLVIAKKGSKGNFSITLRKVSNGVAVEKIYPLNFPMIEKMELIKKYKTRKSKLYYTRSGKVKLKEDKSEAITKAKAKAKEKTKESV